LIVRSSPSAALAPRPATLLIRVDANAQIGSGHFMRCLALAQAWSRSGESVVFATTSPIKRLNSESSFKAKVISAAAGTEADAAETRTLATELNAAWVILDGYHFCSSYQQTLKGAGFRLMVIDDHGHSGSCAADLVLDQNLNASSKLYSNCTPATRILLGSRFTLLREEFQKWRSWTREFPSLARRVLVTFGGADPVNATAKAVAALSSLPQLEVVAVLGAEFQTSLPPSSNVTFLRDVPDMAAVIADCDLAVTAAGSTCWELALLQTPMILIPIAENQTPIAEALAAAGAASHLGWHADVTVQHLADAVSDLAAAPHLRRELGTAAKTIVDGRGAARVVTQMKALLLQLRPATHEDCRRVWEWSNEISVRAASFCSDSILWEDHSRWFSDRLQDSKTVFYIAEHEVPVGQSRFVLGEAHEALISISVDAAVRGRGLGAALIVAACERLFRETDTARIRALIKLDNTASLQAFDHAGFRRADDTAFRGNIAAEYVLEREAA
jgi:UDP-2,4-diacetamido-2,4,6-trideoxy-beta-L-altropyranose hydrolase